MLRFTIYLTLIYCLTSCSNLEPKPIADDNRTSLPEPDKDLREKYEALQKSALLPCVFDNPDTSLFNIKLRDAESATTALNVKRLNGDTTYNFSTADKREILSVTVYPGDFYSQVSVFQVKYAQDKTLKVKSLSIDHFTSEKNIKLGLSKNEVVSKLGHCYSASDSTNKGIRINYKLQSPQDSRTKLLERQNMPIYYAAYIFSKDKLIEFEFGFEYP